MLDSYFNLPNKSNLADRLSCDLMQLFDHLVVAYFFGPPCIITTGDRFSTFSELEAYLRLMARFGWQ